MTTRTRRSGSGRSRGPGKKRRALIWQGSIGSADGLPIGSRTTFDLVDVSLQSAYFDSTVVRIRGEFTGRLDTANNAPSNRFYVGIIVVSDEAAAVGATAVPRPSIDTAADWIYWSAHPLIGNAGNSLSEVLRVVIDNKSARKLPGANKRLVLVVENVCVQSLDFNFVLRTLVMLH